jgi:hypothetical protein
MALPNLKTQRVLVSPANERYYRDLTQTMTNTPRAAQNICLHHCPALKACTRMLRDGLDTPSDMVQAGIIVSSGTSQPRKASSTPGKSSRLELAPSR